MNIDVYSIFIGGLTIFALERIAKILESFYKRRKQQKHKCLNQIMEGDYQCEVCNP